MSLQRPLPLAIRGGSEASLENFVGAGNELVLAQVRALAESGGDWLYLHGPAGAGKTHLLIAACRRAREQGLDARYLSLVALGAGDADPFQGLETAQLVALDSLDTLQGQSAHEVGLFHAYNRMRGAGTALLIGARSPLGGLSIGLPDLRSRLGQCVQLGLRPLDEAGLRVALKWRAGARGLEVPEAVWDYLLRHGPRDLGGQLQLLARLDSESLARKRGISVPMARDLLHGAGSRPQT